MKISRQDVEQAALLSRLEISDNEAEKFTGQLNAIFGYIDMLGKVDTENVEPTAHVLPLKNVMRPDEVRTSLPREQALANAPAQEDGFFKVPKILEG